MRLAKSLSSSDLRRESTAGAQRKQRLCQRSRLYRRAVAAVACGLGAPACHPPESFGCLCEQQVRLARLDRQRRCGGIPFSAAELTGRDLPAGRQQWRTQGFPTDTAAANRPTTAPWIVLGSCLGAGPTTATPLPPVTPTTMRCKPNFKSFSNGLLALASSTWSKSESEQRLARRREWHQWQHGD